MAALAPRRTKGAFRSRAVEWEACGLDKPIRTDGFFLFGAPLNVTEYVIDPADNKFGQSTDTYWVAEADSEETPVIARLNAMMGPIVYFTVYPAAIVVGRPGLATERQFYKAWLFASGGKVVDPRNPGASTGGQTLAIAFNTDNRHSLRLPCFRAQPAAPYAGFQRETTGVVKLAPSTSASVVRGIGWRGERRSGRRGGKRGRERTRGDEQCADTPSNVITVRHTELQSSGPARRKCGPRGAPSVVKIAATTVAACRAEGTGSGYSPAPSTRGQSGFRLRSWLEGAQPFGSRFGRMSRCGEPSISKPTMNFFTVAERRSGG